MNSSVPRIVGGKREWKGPKHKTASPAIVKEHKIFRYFIVAMSRMKVKLFSKLNKKSMKFGFAGGSSLSRGN
jgi:hypothetical protein